MKTEKEHIIQPWNNLEPLKVQLGVGGPCGMAAFKSDCINMGHLLRYQFHEIFFLIFKHYIYIKRMTIMACNIKLKTKHESRKF